MVIEAVRCLTRSSPDIAGFRFQDVKISNALIIPTDDDGIEAQLHMHSHGSSPGGQGFQVWDFTIYSVSGLDWKSHCSGQVAAEPADTTDLVSPMTDFLPAIGSHDLNNHYYISRDHNEFYQHLNQRGYHFGPNFRTLENIKIFGNRSEATATVQFSHIREQMKRGEVSEYLIHPATLDSLFHVMMATQYKGSYLPRVVPTHLSEVFVSADELRNSSMENMLLHGEVDETTPSGICGRITATNATTGNLAVTMNGCRFSSLMATNDRGTQSVSTSLFHRMHWKPDIGLMSRSLLDTYLHDAAQNTTMEDEDLRAEIVCRHFLSMALQDTPRDPEHVIKPHMVECMKWADEFNSNQQISTTALIDEQWPAFHNASARAGLIEEWAGVAQWRKNIVLFCMNLPHILKGEKDPLDILFNQGIAESIYRSPLPSATTRRLAAYVDLLAHKRSNMTILEVGAGTGSTTSLVLETLMRQGDSPGVSPRFARYDFTDISPSFFAHAQKRYTQNINRMRFKILDLERDPIEQGFEAESYDIIIASAVSISIPPRSMP